MIYSLNIALGSVDCELLEMLLETFYTRSCFAAMMMRVLMSRCR